MIIKLALERTRHLDLIINNFWIFLYFVRFCSTGWCFLSNIVYKQSLDDTSMEKNWLMEINQ